VTSPCGMVKADCPNLIGTWSLVELVCDDDEESRVVAMITAKHCKFDLLPEAKVIDVRWDYDWEDDYKLDMFAVLIELDSSVIIYETGILFRCSSIFIPEMNKLRNETAVKVGGRTGLTIGSFIDQNYYKKIGPCI
jgi:hypothetical protein